MLALVFGAQMILVADNVPTLNVEPSCRAAATYGAESKSTFNDCMTDENSARAAMAKEWGTFKAADVRSCLEETNSDGTPSYVELQECLELARDAAKYPNPTAPKI
jgi:hypothetical protein